MDLTSLLSFDEYVSGEKLSETLGMTRAAVWKRVEALRSAGILVEGGGRKGYRLVHDPESLDPLYWKRRLNTLSLGQNVIYAPEMSSTNTVLKKAAQEGAPHGTLAICDRQTQGKGRMGRVWETAEKGAQLTCSILLRPTVEIEKAALFTLITGLSMVQAIKAMGLDAGIKWPNDLVYDGKKLCGILLEMAADMDGLKYVVLGTGVNLKSGAYPEALSFRATSLQAHLAPPVLKQELLLNYLNLLENNLATFESEGFPPLKAAYEERCVTLQSRVNVLGTETFTGMAQGIDDTGALLVIDEKKQTHRVIYGDVSVRGVMGYV